MQASFSKWTKLAGMGAVAMIAMAGCSNNADNSTDTATIPPTLHPSKTADNMATAAGNVTTAAGNELKGAGNVASNAASGVAGASRAVVMTPNVKKAIGDKMPTANLNVDTDGKTKTITLKGTVANAAQVKLAEATAKKEAPDYKIVNELKAVGKTSPMMKKP